MSSKRVKDYIATKVATQLIDANLQFMQKGEGELIELAKAHTTSTEYDCVIYAEDDIHFRKDTVRIF